jgi:small-conductance mechanosensitive channel
MHALRVLALLAAVSAGAASAQPAATPEADSTLVDAADSTAAPAPDSVEVLTGEAGAQLDSAAVAALTDTTARVADALGDGVGVALFGRTLFEVWGGLGPFSPEARAARLSERLEDLARSRDVDPGDLRVVDGESLTTLQAGEVIVMTVTGEDARALGRSRAEAAVGYRQVIVDAVERYREQATLRGVVQSAALSVLLLALLVAALRGLGWALAWLDRRTVAHRRLLVRPLRVGPVEVFRRDQVARMGRALVGAFRLALSLALVYAFLTTVFGLFPWTQTWSEGLLGAALSPLRRLGAILLSSVDNVIAIVVIVVVVRWLMRLSDYLFVRVEREEIELAGFHADLADPTRKIAKFLLGVLAVMLVYPYTPIVNSPVFQGLTVFLGILFSLGSSTAIANMVAGIVLTYSRAFRIGDRVKVGDTFGDVVEKSFLVTRIRTPKNEDISVPNAAVLSGHIVNYSVMARDGSGVVLHTDVTIGYDVPWPQVHALLTAAARDTDGVEADPSPFVLQTALGDFSVAYQLNVYTHEVKRMARIYSDLHQHIQDRFAEAEVEILSPTYGAWREGPSTVPDAGALRASRRRLVTGPAAATDGADEPPPEEVPVAKPPPFLGGDGT